jgi:hypothetical protein
MGLAYWYAVLPLHGLVFDGMLRGIRRTAERLAGADDLRRSDEPAEARTAPKPNLLTKDT